MVQYHEASVLHWIH